MKRLILSLIFFLCLAGSTFAAELNLNQILQAVCRVQSVGGLGRMGYGSGTCIGYNNKKYYILTNAHVIQSYNNKINVEFFRKGKKTPRIPAKTEWMMHNPAESLDFAVVSITEESLNGYIPRVIPLVPPDYKMTQLESVSFAGSPEARWPSAWEGLITSVLPKRFSFTPAPLPGQSGSGVCVVIQDEEGEYHTRVGGVITWRVGEGENAFGQGVYTARLYQFMNDPTSFKPEPVEVNYTPQDYEVAYRPYIKDGKQLYAKGNNGKYYQMLQDENGKPAAEVPQGVEILEWYVELPFHSGLPNRPKNPFSPNNGGGGFPDLGGDDVPTPEPEEPPLENVKIKELEQQIEQLVKERDELALQLKNCKENHDAITNELNRINEENKKLGSINEEAVKENEELKQALKENINSHNESVNKLIEQINEKDKFINELSQQIESLKSESKDFAQITTEKESATWYRNLFAGLSGILSAGVLSLAGYLWKYRKTVLKVGGKVIKSRLEHETVTKPFDEPPHTIPTQEVPVQPTPVIAQPTSPNDNMNPQPQVEPQPQPVQTPVIQPAPQPQTNSQETKPVCEISAEGIVAIIRNELGALESRLDKKVESAVNYPSGTIYNTINAGAENRNQQRRRRCKKHQSKQENVKPAETSPVSSVPVSPYIIEWGQHKIKDGENLEHWALYAVLYKEAMRELRAGNLYHKTNNKLQGQKVTADKIDDWVRKEFLSRVSVQQLAKGNELFNEAMIGFLYKEAVEVLRNGGFGVLGAKETADAIEKWVQEQFLRRMNVRF